MTIYRIGRDVREGPNGEIVNFRVYSTACPDCGVRVTKNEENGHYHCDIHGDLRRVSFTQSPRKKSGLKALKSFFFTEGEKVEAVLFEGVPEPEREEILGYIDECKKRKAAEAVADAHSSETSL